jgi:hypothetical protein
MYKDVVVKKGIYFMARSTKLCPSRLEQVDLASVFYTEEDKVLKDNKVDATMADHLVARGPTHSRKTEACHLM